MVEHQIPLTTFINIFYRIQTEIKTQRLHPKSPPCIKPTWSYIIVEILKNSQISTLVIKAKLEKAKDKSPSLFEALVSL